MATKRINQLTQTATEADLVAGNHLVVDTTEGTKRLPAGLVAKASDIKNPLALDKLPDEYPKDASIAVQSNDLGYSRKNVSSLNGDGDFLDGDIGSVTGVVENGLFFGLEKCSYEYVEETIDVDSQDIKHGYVENNGVIKSSDSHGYFSIPVGNIHKVTLPQHETTLSSSFGYAIVIAKNGNRLALLNEQTQSITMQDGWEDATIYFNCFGHFSGTRYAVANIVEKSFVKKNFLKLPSYNVFGGSTLVDYKLQDLHQGFCDKNGNIQQTTSTTHKYFIMDAADVSGITIGEHSGSLQSGLCYVCIKDKVNGSVYAVLDETHQSITIKDEWKNSNIYVNAFNLYDVSTTYPKASTFVFNGEIKKQISNEILKIKKEIDFDNSFVGHIVAKPFAFNGKRAVFFGDSITQGFINGTTVTPNGYPKLFSEAVGMTYDNKGLGGACLCPGLNEIQTIKERVLNYANYGTTDFVFIAGGTNDYTRAVSESLLRSTLQDICDHLKDNFTGDVIFISPINRISPAAVSGGISLNKVRCIIREIALYNDFNFVNGQILGFPTESGEYATKFFGDLVHPSTDGYKMYAKALRTALL